MSSVSQTSSTAAATNFSSAELSGQLSTTGTNDGYNSLGTDDFLALLVQELQNQDPLNPMDNADMVAQIGQIREIGATDELTGTLNSLSNNQQLVTASGLIGKNVQGLADDQSNVDGIVDRVTVETNGENDVRSVKVHVGGKTMNVENIREIQTE
ncbi:flagellar basal-body rod modification protein FlgD [Neorhodopirellula lusitana]|uniref:Basal-body rod modification protein FlgD n=1 Tax=Neorhodopirellula lusitana TaxID=445327 RepID=A0ABY1Q9W9_9BACT|nr:flagellar hook capping FlgD N-terminal domain-containing protein [Neorhodopirellula lusitana]SMP62303.1 flagellar basal-body rod modification protein FlgD [Neorhodopirellula lusitana]